MHLNKYMVQSNFQQKLIEANMLDYPHYSYYEVIEKILQKEYGDQSIYRTNHLINRVTCLKEICYIYGCRESYIVRDINISDIFKAARQGYYNSKDIKNNKIVRTNYEYIQDCIRDSWELRFTGIDSLLTNYSDSKAIKVYQKIIELL